jgi:hypothetical protein
VTKERDGCGMQIWSDLSVYEGTWKNDLRNGTGRMILADDTLYLGEW